MADKTRQAWLLYLKRHTAPVHKNQDEKQKPSIHKVKSLMNTRYGADDGT